MEQQKTNLEISPSQLSFKQFLEKVRDDSGLSQEDFLKYKITIPIKDLTTFNIIKNLPKINIEIEKRTEAELKDQSYLNELKKIDPSIILINTELNEFYAKTIITQYYKNYSNNPIELILKFPYNPSVQFSQFTLEMNNKLVVSKVLDKEKAEEKYNDDIAKGNVGAVSSIKDKNINVTIGNIEGGELIKLTTEFIQFLNTEDMSFCFQVMKNFPEFNTKKKTIKLFKIQANINIKTHSKITRLITKGFLQNLEKKFNNDYTQCKLYYSTNNNTREELGEKELKILFRTESMNNMNLITQYDPKKDETSCIFNLIYNKDNITLPSLDKPDINDEGNYIELYQKNIINSHPSLFIFLIDQSGSMDGTPMELVKESLIFFLQSLPKNSFYQLIGFGTNYRYITSKQPNKYDTNNVTETISKIENLEANLGGTRLLSPLKGIFSSKNYAHINLCRNLFILTDGEVEKSQSCLDIISNNSDTFRIHSFGFGNYYDKQFIEKAGQNGSVNLVNDISKIKSEVIKALNKALRGYLYNPKLEIENIEKEHEFIPKEKVYYQDESFNYYTIIKHKIPDKIKANFEYYDKLELVKKEYFFDETNILKEEEGDIISKIIVGNILNNNNDMETSEEIALAKKYQVLSKSTALYAKLENENANKNLSQLEVVEQSELKYIDKKNISNESSSSSESESKSENDSEDENEKYVSRKYKRKRKCRAKKKKVILSESCDSEECKKVKRKKKCKKKEISSDSEDEPKKEKASKKRKVKKNESNSSSIVSIEKMIKKEKKKKKSDSESPENNVKEEKKETRSKNKCKESLKEKIKKDISDDNDEIEEKCVKKKCKKISSKKRELSDEEEDKINNKQEIGSIPKEENFIYDFKKIVLTQNIIEGNWSLNPQTKHFISINQLLYDKIKNYVEKYYQKEDKEDIIITILVLYYLKNNKDIEISEYLLIINKGIEYLQSKGIKEIAYETIEPYLNN